MVTQLVGYQVVNLLQGMEAEFCSVRTTLSPSQYESGDEELSVLPRHTKVIVTGNNRTKSVLVGLQGVVKKAVGLGGWHWLVLKNGVEVKLQRNALSVLEAPTGNEDDDDIEYDNSFCSSSDRLNLAKLGTPTLRKYWRHFNLVNINPNPTKEQLILGVQNHLLSQQLDEMQVIMGFIHSAKRLKTVNP
ncbi:hypothetical protein ZIOFF_028008 [Zingiber officinale]|uniref:Histone deacetylase complex subunit SAP30 Sin3 binding domain-containing protein n=1 Tax=Zingiber officinale TaxID=94328 RepID=A0A8J5H5A9_ZINOF|nr:hypothetical protein ZIOFF_028008 [Zingiber officinale]